MIDELKQWEYDKGYTKGYSDGRASLVEELEKIKAELKNPKVISMDFFDGLAYAEEIIDKHISEMKGEKNDIKN